MLGERTVGVPEFRCVSRVVITQPEVHMKSNITRQWVIIAVLHGNFGYLDHLKTDLDMLASTILGGWNSTRHADVSMRCKVALAELACRTAEVQCQG